MNANCIAATEFQLKSHVKQNEMSKIVALRSVSRLPRLSMKLKLEPEVDEPTLTCTEVVSLPYRLYYRHHKLSKFRTAHKTDSLCSPYGHILFKISIKFLSMSIVNMLT